MSLLSLLYKQLKDGTLPHAVLVHGAKGTGKYETLQTLGKTILGEQKLYSPYYATVDRLYMDGVDDNLEELSKSTSFNQIHRKKSKKKTDTIGMDDIEAITTHLHETIDGEYKILIIRDIERMTIPASNKFLKILEEPPQKTLFLLTSSQKSKLLPTIISRVQLHSVPLLSDQQEKDMIQELFPSLSSLEQKELQILSSGRKQVLKRLATDDEYKTKQYENVSEIKKIFSSSDLQKINSAEQYAKYTIREIENIFFLMEQCVRQELKKNINSVDHSKEQVSLLESIQTAREEILKNGNKRMVLESLFLRI